MDAVDEALKRRKGDKEGGWISVNRRKSMQGRSSTDAQGNGSQGNSRRTSGDGIGHWF